MQRSYSYILAILLALVVFAPSGSMGQSDSARKKTSIAVFSPLYLDSAFDASGNYRYGKTFPKHFAPGLEFYEGIQLAIDSLQKENLDLDIHIYDTRSSKKLESILASEELKSMDLLLGYVNMNEAYQLARAASVLEVPFVNVNLPNEAGVKANPHYVILNPTLGTHINAIYRFLQKNHALSSIIYFRKKGAADDRLKAFFTDAEKSTASVPLKMRYVMLDDSITTEQLRKFLDSSKTNICIAGSLDMNFSLMLTRQLASLGRSYKTTLFGMPTWDQVDFNKPAYRGIEIVYSNSLYINPENKLAQQLQHHFKTKYFARTADIIYQAFESLYYFSHVLHETKDDFETAFGKKKNTLFGEFDIQPVNNKQTGEPEYFENKKIFFIKKLDGTVKTVY